MELHISILQTHGPVPTLTGDPRAAASRPASRAAVKVKAAEERPAREQEAAKPPGPRRPRFPEERGPGGAEAGLGGRHGEQQRPPSAAVTPRPPAGRGSARAVPVSGPAWASREDGAHACRARPVPRASLGAGHTGASQHTPARGVRYARATGGNRKWGKPGAPLSQQGAGPTGAHGQGAGAEGKLGARGCGLLPPPQDAGERAVGSALPGERQAWHAARGAALTRSPSRAPRPVSSAGRRPSEMPWMPALPPLPSGEPDPLGRASGQATRCVGTGEEGARPAGRPGLQRKSIRERRAGSLTVSSEREARGCAGNTHKRVRHHSAASGQSSEAEARWPPDPCTCPPPPPQLPATGLQGPPHQASRCEVITTGQDTTQCSPQRITITITIIILIANNYCALMVGGAST